MVFDSEGLACSKDTCFEMCGEKEIHLCIVQYKTSSMIVASLDVK